MKGVREVKFRSGNTGYVIVLKGIYYGSFRTREQAEKRCLEINNSLTPIIRENRKYPYEIYIHNGNRNGDIFNKVVEITMKFKIKFDYDFYKLDSFKINSIVFKLNKKFKKQYLSTRTIINQKMPKTIPYKQDYYYFKSSLTFKSKYEKEELFNMIDVLYNDISDKIQIYH